MTTKPYQKLMQRIENGERILIDGATGTEVERRGVPVVKNSWNCNGNLSHPQIVQEIHEDYIEHGAEVIITNTFGSGRHSLRDAGIEDRFEEITESAVDIAQKARDNQNKPNVLIAGGITHWSWTDNQPSLSELHQNISDQCQIMKNCGVDFIMLEMFVDVDRLDVALDAVGAIGLPVWSGLTLTKNDQGNVGLRNSESLDDAVAVINKYNSPVINVMHTDVELIDDGLDALKNYWNGFTGVYAHTGTFNDDSEWHFEGTISPDDYAAEAQRWLGQGVNIIGGCCGISSKHIAKLKEIVG